MIREGYDPPWTSCAPPGMGPGTSLPASRSRERERTGIGSLKVGFNKVFGYYLEVTKANLEKVPDDYVRKQTLANAERFFTPELKEWEEKVFGAEDRIQSLETELFSSIRGEVAARGSSDPGNGRRVATLDVLGDLRRGGQGSGLCSAGGPHRVRTGDPRGGIRWSRP